MRAAGGKVSSRWSAEAYARRLELEVRKRRHDDRIERRSPMRFLATMHWVEKILRISRMHALGHRRFLDPVCEENHVRLPGLPASFEGFRILHLSDLHFDLEPELFNVVRSKLSGLSFDACLMSGDFRDRLSEYGDVGVRLCAELASGLGVPVFACLGNHDRAADLPVLEGAGIRVLVNESAFIERGQERLYVAGVDDSGYYKTDDFDAAFSGIPAGACSVVMCHDPAGWPKAAEKGAAFMLSGHTHGGQICLPGGFAPLTHSDCPRQLVAGAWARGPLVGYTSRGTGGSRIAARFFCPGEIVVHTLSSS